MGWAFHYSITSSAIARTPAVYARTLILAHRRRTQNVARVPKDPLEPRMRWPEPLVITPLGYELQADRHAEAIKAHGQGRSAQSQVVCRSQIVHEVTIACPHFFGARLLSGRAV